MSISRSSSVARRPSKGHLGTRVLTSSKGGLRALLEDGSLSPLELDEPDWMEDEKTCKRCNSGFSLTNRRHHCRRCGSLICGGCIKRRMVVRRLCYSDPVIVCSDCEPVCLSENEFFEKHLPALLKGFNVHVRSSSGMDHEASLIFSKDHRSFSLSSLDGNMGEDIPFDAIVFADKMTYPGDSLVKETVVFETRSHAKYECAADPVTLKLLRRSLQALVRLLNPHHVKARSMQQSFRGRSAPPSASAASAAPAASAVSKATTP